MNKEKIDFKTFLEISDRLEINVGKIISASRIPKKDKLLALTVIFSEDKSIMKSCVTNLGEFYEPDDFLGNKLPFIMNLEPAKMGGVLSEVMLMVSELNSATKINLTDFEIGGKLM